MSNQSVKVSVPSVPASIKDKVADYVSTKSRAMFPKENAPTEDAYVAFLTLQGIEKYGWDQTAKGEDFAKMVKAHADVKMRRKCAWNSMVAGTNLAPSPLTATETVAAKKAGLI